MNWIRTSVVLPVVLGGLLAAPQARALSLAPGLFLVQKLKPGDSIDLRKFAGVVFTVRNETGQDAMHSLACRKPSQGGLPTWEEGYEEIPDPAWCKLEKEEFVVPAKGTVEIGMTIQIPDKPEHYNGKWLLAVVLTAGASKGIGVGLAVAARVQIETQTSTEKTATGLAPIAVIPGVVAIAGAPGAEFKQSVLLKNTSAGAYACSTERLPQVYPDSNKHARYTSGSCQALVAETWLNPLPPFALAPGAELALELTGKIPPHAKPGERREELVFIRAADDAAQKDPARKPYRTFVRVRYEVAGGAGQPEGAGKK